MVEVKNGEYAIYGETPLRDAQIGGSDADVDPIKALGYAGASFASDRSDDMGPVAPDAITLEKVRGFVADNAGKTALAGLGIATFWVLKKYYRNHHGHNQD